MMFIFFFTTSIFICNLVINTQEILVVIFARCSPTTSLKLDLSILRLLVEGACLSCSLYYTALTNGSRWTFLIEKNNVKLLKNEVGFVLD